MAGLAALMLLTWAFETIMPPPYSGFLAACVIGLTVTGLLKRRPRQRALRMFSVYLRARERGADERAARERLLAWLHRNEVVRQRLARDVEAHWTGQSEKARVIGGVGALLARERRAVEGETLAAIYDRARDRFTIPGWESLPAEFVGEVRRRLEAPAWTQLDALAGKHRLFDQKFFRSPVSLGADPRASVIDLARLLQSLGNRLAKDEPGDAERAYRLSLELRPDDNLAHAGLALLLEQTGRHGEAAREATVALKLLDAYAGHAADREPTIEDISPFRSPKSLREALERAAASAEA
jgi:hypothetical protein